MTQSTCNIIVSFANKVVGKKGIAEEFIPSLGWVAQLVGASSGTPKGRGFDSRSRHIPKLPVQSPVGVHTGGNQLVSFSHRGFSFSLPSSL